MSCDVSGGGGGKGEGYCGGNRGDGGGDGGSLGGGDGGGGATARGTVTPTSTVTGAAETTVSPRLVERSESGCAMRAVAEAVIALAVALAFPGPPSGIVKVAATSTEPAEREMESMHEGV